MISSYKRKQHVKWLGQNNTWDRQQRQCTNQHRTALCLHPVGALDICAYPIGVLDIGKALGLPGVTIHDDPDIHYLASSREQLKDVPLLGFQAQIVQKDGADVFVQLLQLSLALSCFTNLWWRPLPSAEQELCIAEPPSVQPDKRKISTPLLKAK